VLQHVDTMIGFSVTMLLLSLLVTVLVQAVSTLLNLRGVNLLWGVTGMLQRLAPLGEDIANRVAREVLKHPSLASAPKLLPERLRYAVAVRSDELLRVLRVLDGSPGLADDVKAGITKILEGVGTAGAKLWAELPEEEIEKLLPGELEKAAAVVASLKDRIADDADHLKAWYDTLMDRASERFAAHTRLCTVVFAALLAFGLSIDSLYLFERVYSDATLRAKLVQSADATMKIAGDYPSTPGQATPESLQKLTTAVERLQKQLDEAGSPLSRTPHLYPLSAGYREPRHLLGMFVTMALLSLGAPFWYNVLRQLANLRPVLAARVDKSEALDRD
jgi:hypothetical protein